MRVTGSLLALSLLVVAGVAHAQLPAERDAARALAEAAADAFDRKDFGSAAELFAKADGVFHAPTLLLGRAQSLEALGKTAEARAAYAKIAAETLPPGSPQPFVDAVEAAKRALAAIEPRVPKLVVDGRLARLTIDGAEHDEVPARVSPGRHHVRAIAEDGTITETDLDVREGETKRIALRPPTPRAEVASRPTTPASEPSHAPAYVALGVGAAGLVVFGVSGAMFLAKRSDLETRCPNGTCPPDARSDRDAYRRLGTIATVGLATTAVGLAAGGALLLFGDRDTEPHASFVVDPVTRSASVAGTF